MFVPLENKLGYKFKNKELINLALTHSSYKYGRFPKNNETMEFLGDKVLGLIIAKELYLNYKEREGYLAKCYGYLTSSTILIEIANALDINLYIKKSKGDEENSLLVDACEALLAAVYLDSGDIEVVRKIILIHWQKYIDQYSIQKIDVTFDPKSALQEWVQRLKLPVPFYKDIKKEGDDHNPTFYVEIIVKNYSSSLGIGNNKQLAQKDAARNFIRENNINFNVKFKNKAEIVS
ncbi:Ribonuclease III [Candidatus Hepatincolaceae symbiont of Richtersius coronifer]